MSELYDITIIGGGPVGLFAAFYANLRQAKVQIIDSLPQLGGQPAILYPEKQILDVPGFPNLTGEELTNRLLEQLKGFDTPAHLNETVLDIEKENDVFKITTTKGIHSSKAVIIAMGGGAFKPRPLELDGVDSYENIHYHVSNIQQYAGKKVTILGGGDSAVDWALAFEKIAPTTLVHRRDNFRALEHSVQALQESSVSIKTPLYQVNFLEMEKLLTSLKSQKSNPMRLKLLNSTTSLSTMASNHQLVILKTGDLTLTVTRLSSIASRSQAKLEFTLSVIAATTMVRLT